MEGAADTRPTFEAGRPGPRDAYPQAKCATCSVRTVCSGCRHGDGCDWCYCDGLGCGSCGTKCRSHKDRDLWQADVGTLDLELDIEEQPALSLPAFVPSVKLRRRFADALVPWTYTVDVGDLIRTDGSPREAAHEVRSFFPEGSQVVLNFFCPDAYLEPIWTMGPEFWNGPWLRQFDAIVAVNYSLYADDSSFEIMHSLKRTQVSAQEIHDAGLPVVPLLSYIDEEQLHDLLESYGSCGLHTVAVNMQVVSRKKRAFQMENVRLLRVVAEQTDWRLFAHGVASAPVVAELQTLFGERLVTSNASPYFDVLRKPLPAAERRARFAGELRKHTAMTRGRRGARPP